MTTFRAVVLEHFRRPRNRRALERATAAADGANPLCGDRIRVQLLLEGGVVRDAAFTADACAICIASASVLTDHVRGMSRDDARAVDDAWIHRALDGAPPPARGKCASLPLDTLHRALDAVQAGEGA